MLCTDNCIDRYTHTCSALCIDRYTHTCSTLCIDRYTHIQYTLHVYCVTSPCTLQDPQPHLFPLVHARIYLLLTIRQVCPVCMWMHYTCYSKSYYVVCCSNTHPTCSIIPIRRHATLPLLNSMQVMYNALHLLGIEPLEKL